MPEALIMVIVPVYNVEQYLEKCIDSLLNQTFEDYAIALVNDGSTDASGAICDRYAAAYPERIFVFHKENGGLSDARNYGVSCTKSQYIVFVDSDDYVHERFLERLISAKREYDCDMVVAPLIREYVKADGTVLRNGIAEFEPVVMDKETALIRICEGNLYGGYAVSKLIHRELVEQYPFPKGKFFEDSYITYHEVAACEKVVCISNAGYYYLQRDGSIQRRAFDKRHLDLIHATVEMFDFFLENHYNDAVLAAAAFKLYRSCYITALHALNSSEFRNVHAFCQDVLNKKRIHFKRIRFSNPECLLYKVLFLNSGIFKSVLWIKGVIQNAKKQ